MRENKELMVTETSYIDGREASDDADHGINKNTTKIELRQIASSTGINESAASQGMASPLD